MSTALYHLARRTDVRLLVIVLGACVAAFAALGFVQAHTAGYGLQAFDLKDSDPATRISLPATFTSILLSGAALLAFATSAVDKLSRQARWRRAGWLFVVLALEELLGVHLWLEHHGVPWIVCYFPLMVIAAAILFDAFRIVSTRPHTRGAFLAGLITWLFAGAFDTAAGASTLALPEVEILEMGAAALFLVALVLRCQYLARAHHPLDETDTRATLDEVAGTVIGSIDVRRLAIGIGFVTGAFALQYVLLHAGNYHGSAKIAILDLNNEQTLWATFQGGVIWAVAVLALLTGALACTKPESRPWWLVLALVLLVLGADEVVGIHDRFQDATGYPGQVILAPVAIMGVMAWLKVVPEIWGNRTVRLLFVGERCCGPTHRRATSCSTSRCAGPSRPRSSARPSAPPYGCCRS